MATSSNVTGTSQARIQFPPLSVLLIMGWQALFGIGCLLLAGQILQIERIFNLPNFVQVVLAALVGAIALASFVSAGMLFRLSGAGRLIGLGINGIGLILTILYLGHILGLYTGLDNLANGLYRNVNWLVGVAAGYLIIWLGNRSPENSPVRTWMRRAGLALMVVSIAIVFVVSGLLVNGIQSLLGKLFQPDASLLAGIPLGGGTLYLSAPLIGLLIALAFGASAYFLMRRGELFGETVSERETWQGWLFLMPNFISFVLFFAGPLLLSFYLSFTDYNPVQQSPAAFIGFRNYTEMLSLSVGTLQNAEQRVDQVLGTDHTEVGRFTLGTSTVVIGARDPLFWRSLVNTVYYCVMLLALSIFPALGLAMLLNSKIPGMKLYRAIFFIPSIAAVVGVALIWQWLYDPTIGYINYTITQVVNGINSLFGAKLTDPAIPWLTDDRYIMLSVVIMAAWQVIGFNSVIFLAGLQGIPKEVMEAATVDGANGWKRFRSILLPLLGPTTFFVTITTLIAGLQAFTEPFSLIGENNPTTAKLTSVYYLYNQGFGSFRMGYASSVAWVVFIAIFIITLIQFRLSNSNQAYSD
jgi:ABC-type sugar transport system permease subunit